ncbi:L-serine ammonia-lyase [Sphingomonas sp. MA1305]|uniref:L-serine ammonia-lyase n=1 Tax=Sphingomonas sp. MA1305 TaxID=2479204 RepID=UPI0018DFC69F|nr:L-serine ammonia-lyase [Sphingomonas sp. MA1305]MBI0477159.1 L-serine ammonia-lyase [Sphingomonas sp. MA1305]
MTVTASAPAATPLDRGLHRPISVAELFTIGIGPSSSHTVGPMRAALDFAQRVAGSEGPQRVTCDLYGSLALTGRGHATDMATILGLAGWAPETLDPDAAPAILVDIAAHGRLSLAGTQPITFATDDVRFHPRAFLPEHPNGMTFTASWADGRTQAETYFSIGGGAIMRQGAPVIAGNVQVPHPFSSGAELLLIGTATGLGIADIVRANEAAWRDPAETDAFLDAVRAAMHACIDHGIAQEGVLPGGLKVRRRAHAIAQGLTGCVPGSNPAEVFEWVSLWALAVNEENAAGGRVVTAPTNGAAGVLPAVLRFYETLVARDFDPAERGEGARTFLLTAAAIGMLYKKRASISAAEMGCQGEVGVACSMAAGALAAVLGGSNAQIENAAEIGMEHNLGLTCDPIGGLVQIPCIERNTMGAVKAINAAYLALRGDGSHVVSLDAVIETMRQTGEDMRSQYKETSLGGLAVNVVEC